VLQHVHRQVVLLRNAVERADEGGQREREPQPVEQRAVESGEIGTPAAAQTDGALREEERAERR
jgi:hypothetical protein